MRVVIVYESLYGNTHLVAQKVAEGINLRAEAVVVPVNEATPDVLEGVDLLVVGGPTHMHGLSTARTREMAESDAEAHDRPLDPDAESEGLREWLHNLEAGNGRRAAAFDTRFDGPAGFTGRASRGIARRLRHHAFEVVAEPESFLVDKENHLAPGEADRAREWADRLI